jgi:transposase
MASPAQEAYWSRTVDHLGLVAGMIDELGLVDKIDTLIPSGPKQQVSFGQAVKAMILNGLGFSQRALYLTPHFFRDKPVERLIGPSVTADQLHDDLLGRTLDALFDYGCTSFYSQLAIPAAHQLKLSCEVGHLDSSSFHTEGDFNSDQAEPEEGEIHIVKGYSRDHRPDLNQVVVQMLVDHQAGIPLLMEPLSGNSQDKTAFRETLKQHMGQLQTEVGLKAIVADSALYTAEGLKEMSGYTWITRVPENLKLAQELIAQVAADQIGPEDEPQAIEISTTYADTRQRWLVVYSPAARQRALATLNKRFVQHSQNELKAFQTLCRQPFACEADAQAAFQRFVKTLKVTTVTEMTIRTEGHHSKRGRPKPGQTPDHWVYYIEGAIASDIVTYQARLQRKSCFILATNELDSERLSAEVVLDTYKSQQKVERGFRFLKDPLFMASTLFLKSVSRVMALTVIMTLCLLVYAALEYRIRTTLAETEQTFPNQVGKPIQNPTVRWVFQDFRGIQLLIIHNAQQLLLNMRDHHINLLNLLGETYLKYYSNTS